MLERLFENTDAEVLMKMLEFSDLKTIVENENELCISIYMPTVKAGSDTKQNPILYKNQIKQSEQILKKHGRKQQEIDALLQPASELIEDTVFWQKQQHGFTAFINNDSFLYYRIPIEVKKFVTVGPRFYVKPLTSLFSNNGDYYLLSLNLNKMALYRCSRFSIEDITPDDFPRSIKEAYAEYDFEKELSFHTRAPQRTGKRDAQFFARGAVGGEEEKEYIYKYMENVVNSFHSVIDRHDLPLIIAGVEYLVGMFREINSYPYLLDEWIGGSPENLDTGELHKRSWEIVSPAFQKQLNDSLQILNEKLGTGYASDSIEEILRAAYNKRVESLFFDPEYTIWGRFDADTQKAHIEDSDTIHNDELVNFAFSHTIKNKGTVFSVAKDSLPNNSPIAATFRY